MPAAHPDRTVIRQTRQTRQTGRRLAGLLTAALLALGTPTLLVGPAAAASPGSSGASAGAWVRGAHLVPGLGTMTLALSPVSGAGTADLGDAIVLAPTASYGDVGDYLTVEPGRYAVGVWPAGSAQGAAPILTGTLDAIEGSAYTVAGLGTKQEPTVTTLRDDLTPPVGGAARIRVLPAASSAPTVDVQAVDGPVVATAAAFGRVTEYATVPSGSWTLQASSMGGTVAGTDLDLAGGAVYTLLVLDSSAGLTIAPVVDASGSGAMPVGGAQTGGGGLAAATGSTGSSLALAGGGALLVAGWLLLQRTRRTPAAPVR